MLREVMPSARTECPVIRVMKDSFQLSALPRHCGDDMTLNTPSIPLSELKTNVTAFYYTTNLYLIAVLGD